MARFGMGRFSERQDEMRAGNRSFFVGRIDGRRVPRIGEANAGVYYRHGDHLGSTSVISDANGLKISGSDVKYAPFGEMRSGDLPALTDLGYTGQRVDRSTGGLMYYGARYYLPGLRRFVSADTVVPGAANPQAFNRYSYVLNNPLRFTDPTGHYPRQNMPVPDSLSSSPDQWIRTPRTGVSPGNERYTNTAIRGSLLFRDWEHYDSYAPRGAAAPAIEVAEARAEQAQQQSQQNTDSGCGGRLCQTVPQSEDPPTDDDVVIVSQVPSWAPDYVTASASGTIIIVQGSLTFVGDRYGNLYLIVGLGIGGPPGASTSATGGYMGTRPRVPTEEELESFLTGWGGIAEAGAGPGIGLVVTDPLNNLFGGSERLQPDEMAIETGLYTPQIGLAGTYGLQLYDFSANPWHWPWENP